MPRPWAQPEWIEPYDPHFSVQEYLLSKPERYHGRLQDSFDLVAAIGTSCQKHDINQRLIVMLAAAEQELWKQPEPIDRAGSRWRWALGFHVGNPACAGALQQVAACCSRLRVAYLNPAHPLFAGRLLDEGIVMVHGSRERLYPQNLGEAVLMQYNPSESGCEKKREIYTSWFEEAEISMPNEVEMSREEILHYLRDAKVTRRIDEVVMHHTATLVRHYHGISSVEAVRRYHMSSRPSYPDGWSDNGYHHMVGPTDGKLFRCRPIARSGAHVKGRNAHTVGVSMFGYYDDGHDENSYGQAGYENLCWLLGALLEHFALDLEDLRFHREFANKTCPGYRFSLERVRRDVAAAMSGEAKPPDVSDWALADVARAKELGLMGGFPDGLFRGTEALTREQGAAIVVRAYDKIMGDIISAFREGEDSD